MLSLNELFEMKKRIASEEAAGTLLQTDAARLVVEVERLQGFVRDFSNRVEGDLRSLEADMVKLDRENERLRRMTESTYFERDACIGLVARLAVQLGMKAGRVQRQIPEGIQHCVIVDLPSGQVAWDYLESEAHLFDWLPDYPSAVLDQTEREIYTKVMNPGLNPATEVHSS